ncbi:unnamed protein product, partial [Mesorhabditis belari]|uniref:Cilia- and flagella-associated protein 410 n=1 Tax=Mesorhabditis belari TaxID=2138241 RepID=A0AAF3FFV0_9BILA
MVKLTESIVYIRTKSSVENVRKLNLWGCDIDDIEICSRMKCIEILSLSVNKVTTLSALRSCENLTELYLRKNEIETLSELEHLIGLKKLTVLWIDENPCTAHGDHRFKVIRMLPQITRLDDKPVTMEEKRAASPPNEWVGSMGSIGSRLSSRHSSTATLTEQPITYGKAIVDTMLPCQMPSFGSINDLSGPMSQSMYSGFNSARSAYVDSMSQSMHPLISANLLQNVGMSQSFHPMLNGEMPDDEVDEENDWNDFNLEEESRPKSMEGIASRLAQQRIDSAPHSARDYSMRQTSGVPMSIALYRRSMSMPRRRFERAQSTSPAREQRHQKLMAAVRVLLDELDSDGLKSVIEEAQKRLKKQR